jgi:hypothetical protein
MSISDIYCQQRTFGFLDFRIFRRIQRTYKRYITGGTTNLLEGLLGIVANKWSNKATVITLEEALNRYPLSMTTMRHLRS